MEKNIVTARAVSTMTCLKLVLEKINPLGFLHLDVEGWDTYALRGAVVALCGVGDTCFVFCEVWDERDFGCKGREEDSPSKSDDESDSSEDEWGEGR